MNFVIKTSAYIDKNHNLLMKFAFDTCICICHKKLCKQKRCRDLTFTICAPLSTITASFVKKSGWGNSRADNSISTQIQIWHHRFL